MNPCRWFLVLMPLLVLFMSCSQNAGTVKPSEPDPDSLKEALLKANTRLVNTEDEQIRNLIERYGWKMKETGTGLRYIIYHQGNGTQAKKDMVVKINYELRLITGDLIYTSKEKGPKVFKIGSGGVESGLEEAILLLRAGDKAKLILPSYLAWGLIGDQDQIPPKSTLIYDIEVVELKGNNPNNK
jgi:FKBP-type peptidyl-prolyl cis-trans isomerase FkpA